MATIPVQITFVAGQILTAAQLNTNVRDAINFLLAPPLFIGRQTVAQSLTSGTAAVVTLDTEDIDRDGGHSIVTNTSRYTSQTAGYYEMGGNISYATTSSAATSFRLNRWSVNGTTLNNGGVNQNYLTATVPSQTPRLGMAPIQVFLNVADFIELNADQNTGVAVLTAVAAAEQPSMCARWVSTGP